MSLFGNMIKVTVYPNLQHNKGLLCVCVCARARVRVRACTWNQCKQCCQLQILKCRSIMETEQNIK
jgi:hypothetical protein